MKRFWQYLKSQWQASTITTLRKGLIEIFVIVIVIVALTVGLTFIAYKMIEVSTIDENVPTVFVAIFTLLLACATVYLAGQTARSNKQNREREDRDRKEKLLNEIIGWSEELLSFFFLSKEEENTGANLLQRCQRISIKQTYTKMAVSHFSDEVFDKQFTELTESSDEKKSPLQSVIDGLLEVSKRESSLRALKNQHGVMYEKLPEVTKLMGERNSEWLKLQEPIQELCDKTDILEKTAISKKLKLISES